MSKSRGESQRIYWQQWLSSNNSKGNRGHSSRRELITSSAAIRIHPDSAKAKDVTQLLRNTLNLSSLEPDGGSSVDPKNAPNSDSLVLVGTLYSLPKDYVHFEHEPLQMSNMQAQSTNSVVSSDPFHVIKTLKPDDNPLLVRDKMLEHLRRIQQGAPATGSTISPKVQWYFVPSTGDPSRSPIPSCIDLDGYCTSMEEEEHCGDSDDESITSANAQHIDAPLGDVDVLLSGSPFLAEEKTNEEPVKQPVSPSRTKPRNENHRNRLLKELRRFSQLRHAQHCGSGYLLKRSTLDPHVWRRVHCILTHDSLWYTTRVPYSNATDPAAFPRMGRFHRRIALSQALLLETNPEISSSQLFRIPHSLDVVSSRGRSHIFRAPNRTVQKQWVQALSSKIMESFENSLLEHAELIVADESKARNQRFQKLAIDPAYCPPGATHNESMYFSLIQASVQRLGMDIAEYREKCRQMQALINASMLSQASGRNGGQSSESSQAAIVEKLQMAWRAATELLESAMQVAIDVQEFSSIGKDDQDSPTHHHGGALSHSSLETHCRHVEYVLTGQHRTTGQSPTNGGSQDSGTPPSPPNQGLHRGRDSPPIDLFDLLLAELQAVVCLPSSG